MALVGISALLVSTGDAGRGVELTSLAANYPKPYADTRFSREDARAALKELRETLPPEQYEVAVELGRAKDLWSTAKQLLTELGG
jgi:hypothetical protein